MKKQYSILSMMFVLTLGLFLASCGAKRDEALVTDFNAKKTHADSLMATMTNGSKMMMADHAAWSAKLDSAGKAGADTAKIAWFKGEMKKMEDMGSKGMPMMDSLKAYENAKTETNDQLKAAIAGLDANITACNTMCSGMMDQHKKLGADIMAFLGGAPAAAAPMEAPKEGAKKSATTTTTTTTTTTDGMDASKHAVKQTTTPTPRRGGGATIKQ
jgi:hypothetical protein